MSMKMDFTGFEELSVAFERMASDELANAEKEALKAGADIVKKNQEAYWNRSGKDGEHIKDNIKIGRAYPMEEGMGINVAPLMRLRWRGKFVEYGTSYQPPQAPVEKSGQQSEAAATRAMMNVMERVIRL